MPRLRALPPFAEIIRRGSFEAAAAALGVTPSAISQRIKGLEERMGEVLIHRGPPARGTAMGLRLMQHLDQGVVLEQALGMHPGTPATLVAGDQCRQPRHMVPAGDDGA